MFFQSLYLVDLDASGKDVPEFEVTGRIKVGAKFDALIVAAGVDGGIEATFSLNLNDTPQADGRMYIDEIVEKIKTPICLFNISGKLSAFLEAWARFGVCPFCHTETWRLATVTLFEWTNKCDVQKPELAREVGAAGDRVVFLNVGVEKALRKAFTGPEHDNESYVVRQMSKDPTATASTSSASARSATARTTRASGSSSPTPPRATTRSCSRAAARRPSTRADRRTSNLAVHRSGRRQARDRQRQLRQRLGQRHGRGQRRRRHHQRRRRHEQGLGRRAGHGHQASRATTGSTAARASTSCTAARSTTWSTAAPRADKLYGNGGVDKVHGGHDITGVPIGQTAPPGTPQFLDKGDEIVGGAGNDTLNGGSGDDKMYGDEQTSLALDADEPGAETVEGEAPGNDLIEGGAGADDIWGGRGNDEVHGGFILSSDGVDSSA